MVCVPDGQVLHDSGIVPDAYWRICVIRLLFLPLIICALKGDALGQILPDSSQGSSTFDATPACTQEALNTLQLDSKCCESELKESVKSECFDGPCRTREVIIRLVESAFESNGGTVKIRDAYKDRTEFLELCRGVLTCLGRTDEKMLRMELELIGVMRTSAEKKPRATLVDLKDAMFSRLQFAMRAEQIAVRASSAQLPAKKKAGISLKNLLDEYLGLGDPVTSFLEEIRDELPPAPETIRIQNSHGAGIDLKFKPVFEGNADVAFYVSDELLTEGAFLTLEETSPQGKRSDHRKAKGAKRKRSAQLREKPAATPSSNDLTAINRPWLAGDEICRNHNRSCAPRTSAWRISLPTAVQWKAAARRAFKPDERVREWSGDEVGTTGRYFICTINHKSEVSCDDTLLMLEKPKNVGFRLVARMR